MSEALNPRCEARLTASLQCVKPEGHDGNHRYVNPDWFAPARLPAGTPTDG